MAENYAQYTKEEIVKNEYEQASKIDREVNRFESAMVEGE